MSCSGKTPTCTTAELSTLYKNSVIPSNINIDSNGIINKESLKSYIETMMRDRGISQPAFDTATKEKMDEVTVFNDKINVFFEELKKEYDFYDARYRYSVDKLINSIVDNATAESVNSYKNLAKEFNKKLNILIQIAQGASEYSYANAFSNESKIQEMNATLNERAAVIKKHSAVLQKNLSNMELRKQMVEYTQEKARATENLLSLYFVLNVFAIGALLYVYKAE